MKKFFSILAMSAAVAATCIFASCSKEEKIKVSDSLENQFVYNKGAKQSIASVGYTVSDNFYTFYLSPTAGITDLDAMTAAGDYILLTASNPHGEINPEMYGNEIRYKDITINADATDYKSVALSVVLGTDGASVKISLKAAMNSGSTLEAEYDGACPVLPAKSAPVDEGVVLDRVAAAYYAEDPNSRMKNYYTILANAEYRMSGGTPQLTEEGWLIGLDLYAESDDATTLPEGTYTSGAQIADHVFDGSNTMAIYWDGVSDNYQFFTLTQDITVTRDGSATVLDFNIDNIGKAQFKGTLKFSLPGSTGDRNKLVGADVKDVVFTEAMGIYMGNLFEGNAGMMIINLYDDKYGNNDGETGQAVTLTCFSNLFSNPKNAVVLPGVYEPSTHFTFGTWMPAVEVDYMGSLMVLGSYYQISDGTIANTAYSYAQSGQVIIEEVEEGFYVHFDLVSKDGYEISGSYRGAISVTDQSDDKPGAFISTLEKDYDLDLAYVPTARLYPLKDVYGYGVGRQYIDIGSRTGKDGVTSDIDTFRMELCTELDKNAVVTPGVYSIPADRYPASYTPGSAVRGHFADKEEIAAGYGGNGDLIGTSFEYFMPDKYMVMDDFAPAYDGTITITRNEGDGTYTFVIDVFCDAGHRIRGTWTGNVVNAFNGATLGADNRPHAAALSQRMRGIRPSMIHYDNFKLSK